MQQKNMTAVFLQWRFTETVFWSLCQVILLETVFPQADVTDATVCRRGVPQGIRDIVAVEHAHNVSVGIGRKRLADTVY